MFLFECKIGVLSIYLSIHLSIYLSICIREYMIDACIYVYEQLVKRDTMFELSLICAGLQRLFQDCA